MVKQLRYAHSAVIFKRITILSLWIFRLLTPQNLKTAIAFPWLLPLFSQNTGKKHSQQYEQSQSSLLWIESCHKQKGYLFFSHRSVCLSWSDLSCFQYQHQWDRCMSACRRASRLKSPFQSEEEMLAKAMDGYFVRDPERNLVICPAGIYSVHK